MKKVLFYNLESLSTCINYFLSQINANLTLVLLFTDEEEEDDKPRPPDDDSVPDMEESFSTDGVGHDVDEYINNNISNDEVGN